MVHERGRILAANRAFLSLFGFASLDEVVSRPALDLVHPDDRPMVAAAIGGVRPSKRTPEHRLLACDGTAIPVEVTGIPYPDPSATMRVAVVHDIRERKRLDAELATAERMVSVGRLAAAVGHEINNPLTYVLGGLDFVSAALAEHGDERIAGLVRELDEVRGGVLRIRDIVRDLRALVVAPADSTSAVDVHRALDIAIATMRHEIDHRARLVRDLGQVPAVVGNEGRLTQVFVNLLANAAQAIPDGAAADHEIRIVTRAEGGGVTVEVLDTGHGFAADKASALFEPFVTTRGSSGTGLGLAIAQRIVHSFGGRISAAPRSPRGAAFVVTLVASAEPPATEQPARVEQKPHRRARVLFVDDEPLIARAAVRALGPHEVLTAESGRAAIALLASGEPIDAVICDLHMPNGSGVDVDEWIAANRPELLARFAFITGGAFTDRAGAYLERSGRPHLAKPFEPAQLVDLLRRLIGF